MKAFLDEASKLYYEGTPIMSDREFDHLSEIHSYNAVGYNVTDAVPHAYPMYSLQKFFSISEAPDTKDYIPTPKLDGAAVSLLYANGELKLALTRGDGKQGRDITEKMATLVPSTIRIKEMIQITGEVVAPLVVPNSRNYASGALNLKDMEEFLSRDITFVAYDTTWREYDSWYATLSILDECGFTSIVNFNESDKYPTDGIVFRIDSFKEFESLGHTSHHPRGAFALKEKKRGVITTLLGVTWQVGKSGVVSPVAILAPVKIGDALVSRATLHNIQYIRDLNLDIGCSVEVIRSGEIIPRIVRRV